MDNSQASPPLDTSALHASLRAATRSAHHHIDHHPLLAPLVQGALSRAHYVAVLQVLYWIHERIEPRLCQAVLQWLGPDAFMPSPRLDWLKMDLRVLGFGVSCGLPEPATVLIPPDSAAATVGMLYVVEGSTLGGRVIARQLAASLGLQANNGAAYFNGHGERTQARWERFWTFAATVCPTEEAAATAARAAVALFTALKGLLDEAQGHFIGAAAEPIA